MSEALDQKLTTLKLGRIRQVYPSWIEQAAHSNLGYTEFLEQLLTEELLAREENVLQQDGETEGSGVTRARLRVDQAVPATRGEI
jgi:DNA replication protein DnaC